MATTYLQRTESAGNRRTFTWSAWVKIGRVDITKFLAACSYSSSDESYFMINSSFQLGWESSTANDGTVRTNRLFRDTNAWYHIVLAVDTTQATASNRIKFYVNGVQETSMSTATYPAQNHQMYWNVGGTYYPRIGKRHASGNEWDGSMSHVVHIDGTQELPTIFGEYDANGVWKIKTTITPSSGWGTNGYWILKDGNSVTDQSGQGNNWTVAGGTLTKTEDNPSNVFATLNPLASLPNTGVSTFTQGNLTSSGATTSYVNGGSTLMMSSGKFYAEMKYVSTSSDSRCIVGITQDVSEISRINQDAGALNTFYTSGNGTKNIQGSDTSYGATWTTGDIIGIALDLDNNKLYFSKNGTWQDSGDPTSGATGTGSAFDLDSGASYAFAISSNDTGTNPVQDCNFGNGYFGTTAVASAGTNASGIGIFEYDVPTGYTALSTKGLNL